MNGKSRVQVIVVIVVLVFGFGIWFSGGRVHLQWLRFYSIAVVVATGALGLWDRVLWHLPLIQRVTSVPRDLRGTWRGTLTSYWEDPETGKTPPSKPAYLVVRQTASNVRTELFTDESRSASSLGEVTTRDVEPTLNYVYLNNPDSHSAKSRIHFGAASFAISGRPARRLKGHYWTDRDSRGELQFTERVKVAADDYTMADGLFR